MVNTNFNGMVQKYIRRMHKPVVGGLVSMYLEAFNKQYEDEVNAFTGLLQEASDLVNGNHDIVSAIGSKALDRMIEYAKLYQTELEYEYPSMSEHNGEGLWNMLMFTIGDLLDSFMYNFFDDVWNIGMDGDLEIFEELVYMHAKNTYIYKDNYYEVLNEKAKLMNSNKQLVIVKDLFTKKIIAVPAEDFKNFEVFMDKVEYERVSL